MSKSAIHYYGEVNIATLTTGTFTRNVRFTIGVTESSCRTRKTRVSALSTGSKCKESMKLRRNLYQYEVNCKMQRYCSGLGFMEISGNEKIGGKDKKVIWWRYGGMSHVAFYVELGGKNVRKRTYEECGTTEANAPYAQARHPWLDRLSSETIVCEPTRRRVGLAK